MADACERCGAQLGPDAEWCGQCFTPVARPQAPLVPAQAAGGRVANSGPADMHTPEYSRWRGGPNSFGPVGRVILTVLVLIVLAIGFPMTEGGFFAATGYMIPGNREGEFLILYLLVAGAISGFAMTRIWRKSRIK